MARVTPRDVVRAIHKYYEFTRREQQGPISQTLELQIDQIPRVTFIRNLCGQLNPEVLPAGGEDYFTYHEAISHIDAILTRWHSGDRAAKVLSMIVGDRHVNVMTALRSVLENRPDDPVAAAVSELAFITDPDVREDLGQDIEEARRALGNREWKSATVVAASVVEALLLWAIDQKPSVDQGRAIQDTIARKKLSGAPPTTLDQWVLGQLIPVAAELKLIEDDTEKQADLARDFRNYVHPGRVQRKGKKCDEATAHAARSAVLLVIGT